MKKKINIIEINFFKKNEHFISFVNEENEKFFGYLKNKEIKRLTNYLFKNSLVKEQSLNLMEKLEDYIYFNNLKLEKTFSVNLIYPRNTEIFTNIQIL